MTQEFQQQEVSLQESSHWYFMPVPAHDAIIPRARFLLRKFTLIFYAGTSAWRKNPKSKVSLQESSLWYFMPVPLPAHDAVIPRARFLILCKKVHILCRYQRMTQEFQEQGFFARKFTFYAGTSAWCKNPKSKVSIKKVHIDILCWYQRMMQESQEQGFFARKFTLLFVCL